MSLANGLACTTSDPDIGSRCVSFLFSGNRIIHITLRRFQLSKKLNLVVIYCQINLMILHCDLDIFVSKLLNTHTVSLNSFSVILFFLLLLIMSSLEPGKKCTTIMTKTFLSCQNANVFSSLTLAFNKLKVLPMHGTKSQFNFQFLTFKVYCHYSSEIKEFIRTLHCLH